MQDRVTPEGGEFPRGRPPKVPPLDASAAARLGRDLQARRLAAGLTGERLGELSGCSKTRISEVEHGSVPSLQLARSWDTVFDTGSHFEDLFWLAQRERQEQHSRLVPPMQLVTVRPITRAPVESGHGVLEGPTTLLPEARLQLDDESWDMERREVLLTFGLIGIDLATSPVRRQASTYARGRIAVDGALLRDIDLMTASYERMRHRVPGRILLDQVGGHIAMIKELLQGSLWPIQRQRLLTNLSQVTSLMSWLQFFDQGDRSVARTWLEESAQAAKEAGDPELCVLAMIRAAEQRTYSGQGHDSAQILESAERLAATKATPKTLSWVLSANAEAHATLRVVEPCLRLLDRAMGSLRPGRAGDEPSWADYWNRSKVWGYVGASHMRIDRPVDARNALTEALGEAEELTLKHQSIYLVDLAITYGQEGEPEEACRLATEALNIAGPMRYSTTMERMGKLRRRLEPWNGEQCVRQLDEQLVAARAVGGAGPSS